ncbi:hypothetical protein MKW92_041780 [Papaver armeniacum]|nr:hypothetical protein MKW92_041780 [Papaver armeniacum]
MNGKEENINSTEGIFIGSLDQGTTSTRFIIYDKSAKAIASHQTEFTQYYPEAGWVEHNPMEILESARLCMEKALDKAVADGYNVQQGGLKAIGITNQRDTTLVWSKSTGLPLYNAIVWMDVRTAGICKGLENELSGGRNHFVEISGLPLCSYFSALKLVWLMENVQEVKADMETGDVLYGTIDTWLIWNLTGGCGGGEQAEPGLHVTDVSNAARTMLVNIKNLDWDQPTVETLGIPIKILPKIVSNSEVIGKIGIGWPFTGVPIAGCDAKCTYGTGAFILLNTGKELITSTNGLLTTLAYKLGPDALPSYALEGSIAIAGAAVQWLRDSLGIIQSSGEIEELAKEVENTGGVYFVPAFNGLFSPWWRDDARGICIGITRYTNKAHIARSVLESICFQVKDVVDSMHKDAGKNDELEDENGDFILKADLLGCPVVRPVNIETTALGAEYAAGLSIGVWTENDIFSDQGNDEKSTIFQPNFSKEQRKTRADSWCKAVSRTFDLANLTF